MSHVVQNLKRVTEEEFMSLSSLKAAIMSHLFPCKPIDVEYSLNPTSFCDNGITDKR